VGSYEEWVVPMNKYLLAIGVSMVFLSLGVVDHVLGSKADQIHEVHAVHLENELGCDVCHENARTSEAGTDDILPAKEVCAGCHDVEDSETCGQCHTNLDAPRPLTRRTEKVQLFSHRAHIGEGMECDDCHGEAVLGEPHLPQKALCRSCHATASHMDDCAVCHAPSEELLPLTHTPGWLWFHGADARVDQAGCEGCHTGGGCQECHAGDNVRPRSHGLNYGFRHAVDARGNEFTCASCHEERSFCVSCHVAERVIPLNHSRADWVLSSGGNHAEEGRFDLESCVACHDEGGGSPVCADCHGR
jgi:hypothetical protein